MTLCQNLLTICEIDTEQGNTNKFQIERGIRGVRQWYTKSAMLFTTVLELKMSKKHKIKLYEKI